MCALLNPHKDTDDTNDIRKNTKNTKYTKTPKVTITIRISLDSYDKMVYLSKLYQITYSRVVETCINAIYDALISGAEKVKKEVEG
jgi:molybdenum cofactor biosynthesis enzyme MoaA